MISGSKSGSTTFLSAAASVASGAATPAISAHLHEERLFFGEDLRVGVVVQGDGLHGALADADPAALAGGRLDLGLLGLHVDDRHLVGADAHAREAGCALVLVDLGDHAAGLDDGLGQDPSRPSRGGVVAGVDEDKCAACLTCVRICPYEVPIIDMDTKKAKIEAAACQGCGICVSECPVKAITLHH